MLQNLCVLHYNHKVRLWDSYFCDYYDVFLLFHIGTYHFFVLFFRFEECPTVKGQVRSLGPQGKICYLLFKNNYAEIQIFIVSEDDLFTFKYEI